MKSKIRILGEGKRRFKYGDLTTKNLERRESWSVDDVLEPVK